MQVDIHNYTWSQGNEMHLQSGLITKGFLEGKSGVPKKAIYSLKKQDSNGTLTWQWKNLVSRNLHWVIPQFSSNIMTGEIQDQYCWFYLSMLMTLPFLAHLQTLTSSKCKAPHVIRLVILGRSHTSLDLIVCDHSKNTLSIKPGTIHPASPYMIHNDWLRPGPHLLCSRNKTADEHIQHTWSQFPWEISTNCWLIDVPYAGLLPRHILHSKLTCSVWHKHHPNTYEHCLTRSLVPQGYTLLPINLQTEQLHQTYWIWQIWLGCQYRQSQVYHQTLQYTYRCMHCLADTQTMYGRALFDGSWIHGWLLPRPLSRVSGPFNYSNSSISKSTPLNFTPIPSVLALLPRTQFITAAPNTLKSDTITFKTPCKTTLSTSHLYQQRTTMLTH